MAKLCPLCHGTKSISKGWRGDKARYYCLACGKNWTSGVEYEYVAKKSKNILIIGDTHMPYTNPDYLKFCVDMKNKWDVSDENVYHVGDIIDNGSISYHEHDPDGYSPHQELEKARVEISKWSKEFPKMKICYGNHDLLYSRKIKTSGLPSEILRPIAEILGLPDGWTFEKSYMVGDIMIFHGNKISGMYAHVTASRNLMRSVIMGHQHSIAGVQWTDVGHHRVFGMCVGCGIDSDSFAFSYGEGFARRPIMAVGILEDGVNPIVQVMGK